MTTDKLVYRNAMARLSAAVNVVTTNGAGGRHGMTVSAVCSVTDDPPTLLVCINRGSAGNSVLKANNVLCINVLNSHHADLSARFAGGSSEMDDRFGDPKLWSELHTGSPVLNDAAVAIDCRIASISEVGTHSVFFCEVADVHISSTSGALIWFNRAYHSIEAVVV
jgi:flavin reductase